MRTAKQCVIKCIYALGLEWSPGSAGGAYAGGGDVVSAISTVSSDMVVCADVPMTIVAGGTPIGIGDRCPVVLIWGSGGGTAIPGPPIKGAANTAVAVPTWGTVGTHLAWVMSQ